MPGGIITGSAADKIQICMLPGPTTDGPVMKMAPSPATAPAWFYGEGVTLGAVQDRLRAIAALRPSLQALLPIFRAAVESGAVPPAEHALLHSLTAWERQLEVEDGILQAEVAAAGSASK